MNFKHIKDLSNEDPRCTRKISLWKHLPSNTFYVDDCALDEHIGSFVDYSYMLYTKIYLANKKKTQTEPYREDLSMNAKKLTRQEFVIGKISYKGTYWKLFEK